MTLKLILEKGRGSLVKDADHAFYKEVYEVASQVRVSIVSV